MYFDSFVSYTSLHVQYPIMYTVATNSDLWTTTTFARIVQFQSFDDFLVA